MNIVKRNLAWLLFAQGATWIMSVTLLLITPRVFGETIFGELSFVVVYVSFFDLVAGGGTNTFLIKTIARDVVSVGEYLVNTIVMKLCLTVILAGMAVGLALVLDMSRKTVILILVGSLGMIANR